MKAISAVAFALGLSAVRSECASKISKMPPQEEFERVSKPDDGKCRVLALMGGGSRGAYEAGVLKAMAEKLDP